MTDNKEQIELDLGVEKPTEAIPDNTVVEIVDEKGNVKTVKVKLSPKETLQKILAESALDPIRVILEKYFS